MRRLNSTLFQSASLLFAGVSVLVVVLLLAPLLLSCTPPPEPGEELVAAPSPTVAAPTPAPVPPTAVAAVVLLDVTTSTDLGYSAEARDLVADHVARWPASGRGGIDLVVALVNAQSFDAANSLLSAHLDGLPEEPSRRAGQPLPAGPDLAACEENPFSRVRCEQEAVAAYNAALEAALDDENRAAGEYEEAMAGHDGLAARRSTEAVELAERVRALPLAADNRGTDLAGGFLRAAEVLNASQAPHRLLIIQSDLLASGWQQPGALHLDGVDVVVLFYDCKGEHDCIAHREAITALLTEAGATSVTVYDPAGSRLLPNVFEAVR